MGRLPSPYRLEGRDLRLHRELLGVSLKQEGTELSWFAVYGREYCAPGRCAGAQRTNLEQFVAGLNALHRGLAILRGNRSYKIFAALQLQSKTYLVEIVGIPVYLSSFRAH
jgi:hypothetical protein